ncbi:recombination protein O N-terminal domain-containing protein [Patescibacteria group bacterium]|nr:recombination protein O N-terminal domain-containing protein [Patescibacteria group bacterium]
MLEHYTTAIVLDLDDKDDLDRAVTLYSKDFGRIRAKAKSIRKITSKLAGHLVPGNIVSIRLIEHGEGGSLQVLDALSERPAQLNHELLRFIDVLNKITPLGLADLGLWYDAEKAVSQGDFSSSRYRRILSDIGLDIDSAVCRDCGSQHVSYFIPRDVTFLCTDCMKKLHITDNEIVKI